MKLWRLLFQSVGVITLALTFWGCYYWTATTWRQFRHPLVDSKAPYFREAFWTLSAIDAALLVIMGFACIQVLRLRPKAAVIYTCSVLALITYAFGIGFLWLLPNGVGVSIGAASGVGSIGTAVLLFYPVPFVYPLLSVVLVNVAWHRLKLTGQ